MSTVEELESPFTDEHVANLARFGIDIDVALAAAIRSAGDRP